MGVYEMLKDAAKLAQRADNVELMRKLLDAQAESLADRERIRTLTEENSELNARLRLQGEMRWNGEYHAYYRYVQNAEPDGPFCPRCWDGDGKPVRLAEWSASPWWKCVVCPMTIQRPGAVVPKSGPSRSAVRSDWLDR